MNISSIGLYSLVLLVAVVNATDDHDVLRYCQLCKRHTMCLYPYDDIGTKCIDLVNGDLDPEEVATIVHEHNLHRSVIASGQETRGNPGPQPPAKNMMEITWDNELARIARRWVLQCSVWDLDDCRDVDRFEVWQNVHVIDIESLESGTSSLHRIPLHVQSWADDVENFDTAQVGMVDFTEEKRRPYIGIAASKITKVGCGRAMYSINASRSSELERTQERNKSTSKSPSRIALEVLVCNYGPIDRSTPHNLYDDGMPGYCPTGFVASRHYEYLCREKDEEDDEQWNEPDIRRSSQIAPGYCVCWMFLIIALSQCLNVLLYTDW